MRRTPQRVFSPQRSSLGIVSVALQDVLGLGPAHYHCHWLDKHALEKVLAEDSEAAWHASRIGRYPLHMALLSMSMGTVEFPRKLGLPLNQQDGESIVAALLQRAR